MTRLSVNLNKVALLRNARPLGIPSVTGCAVIAIEAGAHGITVHPRPDQRHIRADDVRDLAQLLTGYKHIEFNIEGNPFHGLVDIAKRVKPHQCTLVPDEESASTSDHGWDLHKDGERLQPLISELRALGIDVYPRQFRTDATIGQVVETFGGHYKVPLVHVQAQDRFLDLLAGVTEPEQKRKIIGEACAIACMP